MAILAAGDCCCMLATSCRMHACMHVSVFFVQSELLATVPSSHHMPHHQMAAAAAAYIQATTHSTMHRTWLVVGRQARAMIEVSVQTCNLHVCCVFESRTKRRTSMLRFVLANRGPHQVGGGRRSRDLKQCEPPNAVLQLILDRHLTGLDLSIDNREGPPALNRILVLPASAGSGCTADLFEGGLINKRQN